MSEIAHTFGRLREEHYNATVAHVRHVHDSLMVLRVRLDEGRLEYKPGQYTTLGLGEWEPRDDSIAAGPVGQGSRPVDPDRPPKLIRRAYSIGSPMLYEGHVVKREDVDFVELYITLVRRHSDRPPMLTPRLFRLQRGDRLFAGPRAHGTYTLDPVQPHDRVVLLATGTGEAPHNAMAAKLLATGHEGQIVSVTCARYGRDLAYLQTHGDLQERFPNYRYVALTTREPENIDAAHPDFVGKQYLQDWFTSGQFEERFGRLDPNNTHVFLCGNPVMVGLPQSDSEGEQVFPEPLGMAEVLVDRGFQIDRPRVPGNVHFETYW